MTKTKKASSAKAKTKKATSAKAKAEKATSAKAKAEKGSNVKVHYKGTLDDGTVFDDSHRREDTLNFEVGSGNLIPAFEEAVLGMSTGETKAFKVPCSEAYREYNPEAVVKVPKSAFPEGYEFIVGGVVQGMNPSGHPIRATIQSLEDEDVLLDHNHPLAGKDLNFEIELVEVL